MRGVTQIVVTALVASASAQPVFVEREIWTAANFCVSVHAADLDGDGDVDVISASADDDTIAWYENDGSSPPVFTRHVVTGTANGAWNAIAVDMDADLDLDLVSASRDDDTVAWYESDGATPPTFVQRIIATTADGAYSVVVRDFDRDTDLDVACASINDDSVAWYENLGGSPPAWTEHVITTAADFAAGVDAADFDRDGDEDLVSVSFNNNRLAWYENDGATPPTFVTRIISASAAGARGVHAADLDGDGDRDIVTATSNNNTVGWWQNNGAVPPAFTFRPIATNALFVRSVFAADIDGDQDLDVCAVSGNDDKVAWHVNDGASPPAWSERVITTHADGGYFVVAADLDGDLDQDVVSASNFDDTVAWYENRGACYPDCNGDGALNLADFGCFQTKFALGDPYADCNGDGVRNLSDFGCFQTAFAVGCP